MIILPDWSNRCLRCCVVGHYSNTCPLCQFPSKDLCMRCHAMVHGDTNACPNANASMEDWVCMTYMPTQPATTALKPRTALDAYYNQRKQKEPLHQHQCSYCNQPYHPATQCPVQKQSIDSSTLTNNLPLPNPAYHTIAFHSQVQSMPPPQISQTPQQPTKPERFGSQPANNIMLQELTRTRTEYTKSKQFRRPAPTKYKQLNTTTTLQFHDTMFQTTINIEHNTPPPPPPAKNAHDTAIQTITMLLY